ncbi:MAG: TadG family pilus assembly protein [Hyphomicrobium sp.]
MARMIVWTRRADDESGTIAVVLAFFMMVSVSACALAVDIGALYLERRTAQGVLDLAAVAAASDIDHAEAAAAATLAANGLSNITSLAVIKGRYEPGPGVAPALRFKPAVEPFNAVRLDASLAGRLYFAKSFMSEPDIAVSAIGAADAVATFSIGSRLASLNGGLVNALLGGLLGGSVSLSVMDYNALLNANVSLDGFLSALAGEVGITAGTYDSVLNANVTVGNVLEAAVATATAGGQAQAAQVATALLGQIDASLTVPPQALVDLGPMSSVEVGQPHAGLDASVNLMSLITATAQAANGDHQVAINLAGSLPGLLSLTLDLAVGEPAQHSGWVTVGQPGAIVRTVQTRLRLVAEVGGSGLLAGVRIRLPIFIEIASAEARLEALTCNVANPASTQAEIAAKPAVVRAWIGDVSTTGLASFGTSVPVSQASLVQVPLITVTASAFAEMTNTSPTDLTFTQSDVAGHVVKTAHVHDLLSSLVASLLGSAQLNVNLVGLPIGLTGPLIKSLVQALLTPVAAALDPLVNLILNTLGLHLGEVDVQVNGMRCGTAVLAG